MKNKKIVFEYINNYPELVKEAESLLKEKTIGVDLESDSLFHYTEKVCLLQVSTDSKNLIIDPLAIKDISPLAPVFADKKIRKIFHGSDYDVRSLYRDFGIEIRSLFDTQIAARILGLKETGLASLLKEYFNVDLEKKYQKKDWSKRPLPDAMISYAVYDTYYLISLSSILEESLVKNGRCQWFKEECDLLSKVRFSPATDDPLFIKFKGARKLSRKNLAVLEAILKLREEIAQKKDRPPFKVLRNDQILGMATEIPSSVEEIKSLSEGQIKKMGKSIIKRIEEALNIPEEDLPVYPKPDSKHISPEVNKRIKNMKNWRNEFSKKFKLEPSILFTNAQIQALAFTCPDTISKLAKLDILKKWQIELFGKELCRMLKKAGN